MKKSLISALLAGAMTVSLFAGSVTVFAEEEKPFEGVKLTMMYGTDTEKAGLDAVLALAKEKLGIEVDIEYVVGGTEGDNLMKVRLASGDAADIINYNSGAKFNALNPTQYFLDLSDQPLAERLDDTFKTTVSVDGKLYGVPLTSTQAGAVMYWKPHYEELGLEVPETWDDFLANCEVIKEAGITPIEATFGESWTSQVLFLGDNYNVINKNPDFVEKFEAGEQKFADTPEGIASFQKYIDIIPYLNEDYLAAKFNDGCEALATGQATHYIMLTQSIATMMSLHPECAENIGVFAIPSEKAEDTGLTVWYPMTWYVNKDASNIDACLALMNFWVTDEALDAYTAACGANGPACIKGYELPDNVVTGIRVDMQKYFDEGKTIPALEFLTSVKGTSCEQITQAVGSGQSTAEEAAAAYDQDCEMQALQLGLDW